MTWIRLWIYRENKRSSTTVRQQYARCGNTNREPIDAQDPRADTQPPPWSQWCATLMSASTRSTGRCLLSLRRADWRQSVLWANDTASTQSSWGVIKFAFHMSEGQTHEIIHLLDILFGRVIESAWRVGPTHIQADMGYFQTRVASERTDWCDVERLTQVRL